MLTSFDFKLDLIENIADNVDRTRDRMAQQTSQITVVDRKDRTFGIHQWSDSIKNQNGLIFVHLYTGYWMVILLLFVAIVVVASIPKY